MNSIKILVLALLLFSGCAASNYGDPTRPDIRYKQNKANQENLRSNFGSQ